MIQPPAHLPASAGTCFVRGSAATKCRRGWTCNADPWMWDLIVDTLGTLVISLLDWWHMHRRQRSFIEAWINKFIARNPHLFRK